MITPIESAHLLLASILLLCGCGSILLIWGSRFSRHADWLAWISVVLFTAALGFAGSSFGQGGFHPLVWARGWIGARGEAGSITFGVLQDGVGILISALAVLLVAVVMSSRSVIFKERKPERIIAGACWSLAGMALSWLSFTPWISLVGWAMIALGGFVALGSGWEDGSEAHSAIRFAKERGWALLLTTVGLCGIAAGHAGLEWAEGASWLSGANSGSMTELMGAILLLLGIFAQLQVFPLHGWVLAPSEANIVVRAVFGVIAPGLGGFAMIYRSERFFEGLELFPYLGVVLLVSIVLTLLSAGFQSRWRQEFLAWLGSGIALAFAVLAFSGAAASLSVFLGVCLGGTALACAATYMVRQRQESEEPVPTPSSGARGWVLAVAFGGICAASGMIGFITSGGLSGLIGDFWDDPAQVVAMGGVVFAFVLVGWKSAWRLAMMNRPVNHGWGSIIAPALLVVVSLGVLWTGTLSGSHVFNDADRVVPSFLLQVQQVEEKLPNAATEAAATCIALSVLACIITYALSRRKEPLWNPQVGAGVSARQFIVSGYRIDGLATWKIGILVLVGRAIVERVDGRTWTRWAATALTGGLHTLARGLASLDAKIAKSIHRAVKVGIEAPGTALQSLQSGDVQWYLMFAIGSSILILLHFLGK